MDPLSEKADEATPEVTDEMTPEGTPEETWRTSEREYYLTKDFMVKRTLHPSEWVTHPNGKPHKPWLGIERLRNEAAALQFIRRVSNIPVPRVYGTLEVDESCFLIMKRASGVSMIDLPEDQKQKVWPEIEQHLTTLREIKSCTTGGPSGLMIPPYRLICMTQYDVLPRKKTKAPEYVFCHNDFAQQNIMVDPETLKIVAIIDWEYSGFWPSYFEVPYYNRRGPSGALEGEHDDVPQLLDFLRSCLNHENHDHWAGRPMCIES
ncbi:hypothetical protein N7488_012228 [Penicillium malachiteum]|nr:hypothetical protein N7488_012228 [Penicillium malachiteum]